MSLSKKKNLLATIVPVLGLCLILATACGSAKTNSDAFAESDLPPVSQPLPEDSLVDDSSTVDSSDVSDISNIVPPVEVADPETPPDAVEEPEPEKPVEPDVPLVLFEGLAEHIFFHPAVAFPELAFDGDNMSQGYDDWFVTADEFKKVITKLYENDYILVDINSLIEKTEVDGKTVFAKAPLYLPEGKKPLVISVDDINYYEYMRENGNVYKLVLDENGDVATYSITPDGKELVSKDNDIVPILDEFVKQHPDFSFKNAKATLALTGYEGTLGYRTNELDSPTFAEDKEMAMKIVARLKETGWNFASHSYGHRAAADITYDHFVKDTNRWLDEVGSIAGETSVYIYPYGSSVPYDDPKFKFMLNNGFHIICGVGSMPYSKFTDTYLFMDRRNVDGYAFRNFRERLLPLFDSDEVVDRSVRPKS